MKAETDPISDDEWLLRLVWEDRVTARTPIISPNAFEPRKSEDDGISLYRRDCLSNPEEALIPIVAEKRPRYAIVQIRVSLLRELNLSVRPAPREQGDVPGHVVIPELGYAHHQANKARLTPIKFRLAVEASNHILRRPATSLGMTDPER